MKKSILIIEDDEAISDTLCAVLRTQGYIVDPALSIREALEKSAASCFDVALLDLGLPDGDGKDIIPLLLGRNAMSILVISARHQENEKVAALDAGADDFINKPFGIDELLARIRVAGRKRMEHLSPAPRFKSGVLEVDFGARSVNLMGDNVKLSPKEFNILAALAASAGQVVTHRQLLLAGWEDPQIDGQYLRSYIGLLRQKIEEDPAEPQIIITEPGVGYRLALAPE
jgi:two-component system KDP operon response regulator KdpE